MKTYLDSIITNAKAAFAYPDKDAGRRYINLYEDGEPTSYATVGDAAEEAIEDGYEGTVEIGARGIPAMLDLSVYGEALFAERQRDADEERDHERLFSSLEFTGRV